MKLDQIVTVDFETYYAPHFNLQALSTSEYIRSPDFKIHMLGMKVGTEPATVLHFNEIYPALIKIDWRTHGLLAHNTAFDGFILSHHFGIVPSRYFDTLSMARGLHSSEIGASLNEVADFYGVGHKIPDVLKKTKGERDLTPELWDEMAEYCVKDVALCFDIFKQMVGGYPRSELDLIDLTIRMFCDPVLRVDMGRAQHEYEREVREQEDTLRKISPDLDVARTIVGSLEFADLLRAEGVEPPIKISQAWLKKPVEERQEEKKYTYAFAKDDDGMQDLLDHPKANVRALAQARLSVKSTGNINKAKRFIDAGQGGTLPVGLSYYRAHTGRFGGANKMNLQNMERGGELRQCILAPEGFQILVADSGQIEARVNAWLWDQLDLLHSFETSDPYKDFAALVYRKDAKDVDKTERFVGKVAVLGLGYQMGALKFQTTLAKGTMGAAVDVSLVQARKIVNAYRAKNMSIVSGWKICNAIIEAMAAGTEDSYKCLSWGKEYILLPNGMKLKYPGLKRVKGDRYEEWAYWPKGQPKKIYGGLLCENIVQALARIIVTDQMLAINQDVGRVVMMTHDEIVAVVPDTVAEDGFDLMVTIMKTPPAWAADLPLSAEGGWAPNYSK